MNVRKTSGITGADEKKGVYFNKTRLKKDGAPQRILKAARKVFAKYPFKTATTRMIADEAKVDHPLIHYHFGSKEELFKAVSAQIYEEFYRANLLWIEGLELLGPTEGFSLFLDRLLEYNFKHPEPLQLILVNLAQSESLEEIPAYQYIVMQIESVRKTLMERIPLKGSVADIEMFIHCFNTLVVSLLGAKSRQAKVFKLDPESPEYRKMVKEALMRLFLPWFKSLIFSDNPPSI